MPGSIYDFTVQDIQGKPVSLSKYKDKVLLIVNVASQCGLTPQYKGLQALHDAYAARGLRILAFPANNFGAQEPGTNTQIQEFCTSRFGVTFDLFAKISVKGGDTHPLYAYLTKDSAQPGDIQWNFQKFLVNKKGEVVENIPPKTAPEDPALKEKIESLLK
jgi:glutathione peroxidase